MNNTFAAYIKYQWRLLAFFGITTGVFLAVQLLSGQQAEFAWYSVLLSATVLMILLFTDAFRFFAKHKALATIARAPFLFKAEFPEPDDLIERDYIHIANELNEQFRKVNDDLTAANSNALEYYTLWVHQIKTPISALRLVLQNEKTDKTVILNELFEIERYADLALQYARMGDIASDIVIEDCDLEAIVRESVKKFALLFIHKKLSVEIGSLFSNVKSDAKWLRFIIEQLISNAVKYTREGGVKIFAEEGALVIVDSGIGIRAEDIPRLFEKGYTGYNGRVDARASGIGLYLAKKAADALSIRIAFESAPGAGTKVSLRFPSTNEWIFE